jgi:transcription-repair coupling factor (superfamily II helicase)
MNIGVLLNSFINTPQAKLLVEKLSIASSDYPKHKIYLSGLKGSSPECFIAALYQHPQFDQYNHLIILNDAEDAAYFYNAIESLTNALDVFYFPSSFKLRKNFKLLNTSHVMLRTEMLTRLSAGGNKKIIVTYPEALAEKVVQSKTLNQNTILIKTNDTIATDTLMETLVSYGFERNDFVYEPGQFALRGGILDIYSFGNEKPYRIELFGNEVDSIRIFDPETQLSERKILQVSIIPNVETNFSEGEKISLFDFLSSNTLIWLSDWDVI